MLCIRFQDIQNLIGKSALTKGNICINIRVVPNMCLVLKFFHQMTSNTNLSQNPIPRWGVTFFLEERKLHCLQIFGKTSVLTKNIELFTSLTYLHKGNIRIEKKSLSEIFSEFHVSDYVDSEK